MLSILCDYESKGWSFKYFNILNSKFKKFLEDIEIKEQSGK